MSSLMHVVYSSAQAHPMSEQELNELLKHSRERNQTRGITGLLLYSGGCFLQVLEGEPDILAHLYDRILVDPRHHRITLIIREPISKRYFGSCTMGLSELTVDQLSEVLDEDQGDRREDMLASINEGRAKKIVRAFSEGRWQNHIRQSVPGETKASLRSFG